MVGEDRAKNEYVEIQQTANVVEMELQGPPAVACGATLGVLATLTSVGAGALGTVFLVYLYQLSLTPPRLIATDIVHGIPLAMFAGSIDAGKYTNCLYVTADQFVVIIL